MTTIASKQHAEDANLRTAEAVFDLAIRVARAEQCSGPNAVTLILGGVALIMVENETVSAAALLRAFADLVEAGEGARTDEGLKRRVHDATLAYITANAVPEEGSMPS